MAGPNHLTTSLHALKICPGVATSKWNERPAAQVSGLRWSSFYEAPRDKDCIGPLHRCHDKYHRSLLHHLPHEISMFFHLHCLLPKEKIAAKIHGVKSVKSWKSSLTLKLPTLERRQSRQVGGANLGDFPSNAANKLLYPIHGGGFFSCKLTAEMTKLTNITKGPTNSCPLIL